ncbi:hypothetical protein CYMTET_21098 [Cymbomonas tetramitiformis]|uniref:acetyl-CoA carboxylase n=1 Tax=Cymbomonas tetramitiformis TaxID=36881 RepID=A0AAE0G2U1_9CHLO|nr:hypothetical protein CYMTET_21098 [Cymbomonas tetramitiformis]
MKGGASSPTLATGAPQALPFTKLLVANRGEVAMRVLRAARELGLPAAAVYTTDEVGALHCRTAIEAVCLPGRGAAAYLDVPSLIAAAREVGADALHPGWGFLSESPALAAACATAGIAFVGPSPEALALFGHKVRARDFARAVGLPVLRGSPEGVDVHQAQAFLRSQGAAPVMLKAVGGGGGRGISRPLRSAGDIEAAFAQCAAEAEAAFGDPALYVEGLVEHAHHVEVQVLADRSGQVVHLHERECSVQRQRQKLVEIAPSPCLRERPELRDALIRDACRLFDRGHNTAAGHAAYVGVATVEFLVEEGGYHFLEVNPRLQVEHGVTEQVTGVDLVATQLYLAAGVSLPALALTQVEVGAPRGFAVQARINMETIAADGSAAAAAGTLRLYSPPTGGALRVDHCGFVGLNPSAAFDPLLAKVIGSGRCFRGAIAAALRGLEDFAIDGVRTNLGLLRAILCDPEFVEGVAVHTRWLEERLPRLLEAADADEGKVCERLPVEGHLTEGHREGAGAGHGEEVAQPGADARSLPSPISGTVLEVMVAEGEVVQAGAEVAVLGAMKMEHVVSAPAAGRIVRVLRVAGEAVHAGQPLVYLREGNLLEGGGDGAEALDLREAKRETPAAVTSLIKLREARLDVARPQPTARRRAIGKNTARENLEALLDKGSLVEYGALVRPAQASKGEEDRYLGDGVITGVGRLGEQWLCVLACDFTVLAGTQSRNNHPKHDRLFELARRRGLPLVAWLEGGGARLGDTHNPICDSQLMVSTFYEMAALSGAVPTVGVVTGLCFAGNANLAGMTDCLICIRDANVGMAGPALIAGGGLGTVAPTDIGPMSVQVPNGVVDLLAESDVHATTLARQYLSFFLDASIPPRHSLVDAEGFRQLIPESSKRAYDVMAVVRALADAGEALELRSGFGRALITALVRIEGVAVGIVANSPLHLGGAIDSDASDKAARFVSLCDAHDVPLLLLCDTPGLMVGPEVEKTALVRHSGRLLIQLAAITVPVVSVVIRKAYGLGGLIMLGGKRTSTDLILAWPTAELGGMGTEGAVKILYGKQLREISDEGARRELEAQLVAAVKAENTAVKAAARFEVDEVIDPADTRRCVASALGAATSSSRGPRRGRKHVVDAWSNAMFTYFPL